MNPEEIDAIVQAAMQAVHAPGAAVAVVFGDAVYTQGYGVRAVSGDALVTQDTLFACASTTKAFTTMALALLIDEKRATWDDLVRKHLPAFRLADPLADANVTLRDLVTHRTGLPRHDLLWYGSPFSIDDILRRVGSAPAPEGFRAKYQYQNICFLAAGEAVRAISGAASFPDFVRERLFAPLGMNGATFSVDAAQTVPDHATPHQRKKNKTREIPWLNMDNSHALGGMNASVNDLAKWIQFLLAGGVLPNGTRLVSKKNLREIWTPQMVIPIDKEARTLYPETTQVSYGMGWSVRDYRSGRKLISHGGAIDGFRANVALLPDANLGIAVLTNSAPSYLPEIVRNTLIDHLLGLPARDWSEACLAWQKKSQKTAKKQEQKKKETRHKNTAPSRPLSTYTGDYENAAYGTARITSSKKNKRLLLSWNQTTARLTHWHLDSFVAHPPKLSPWEKSEVSFTLDSRTGDPVSLTLFGQTFTKQ